MLRRTCYLKALCFAQCGVFATPDPEKRHGTEDAFFTHPKALGVADGVGGWAQEGVHSGVFARATMHGCLEFIKHKMATNPHNLQKCDALQVLEAGHQFVLECAIPGSAPAVVCTLKDDDDEACRKNQQKGQLFLNNLGDCGIMIVRGGDQQQSVVYRSTEQQHYFNCPYQLSSQGAGDDNTRMGEIASVEVQQGDFVVMASDGLWDNVDDATILKLLKDAAARQDDGVAPFTNETLMVAAQNIGAFCETESNKQEGLLPFGQRCLEQTGERFEGGKIDDITVVVARVDNVVETQQDTASEIEGCPSTMDVVHPLASKKRK